MFQKSLLLFLFLPCLVYLEPIELTDQTWREMLTGQWMVEFYAPWCSACQQFKRTWSDFSNAMSPKSVKVAAVDVEKYAALSARFRVTALPTIYFVNDGAFRQFDGDRSLNGLKNYITNKEWQKTEPIPYWSGPGSPLMTLMGLLFDLSTTLRNFYTLLQDDYRLPTWFVYLIFGIAIILLGSFMGFIMVFTMDTCYSIFSRLFSKLFGKKKTRDESARSSKSEKEQSTSADSSGTQVEDEETDSNDESDGVIITSNEVTLEDYNDDESADESQVRRR